MGHSATWSATLGNVAKDVAQAKDLHELIELQTRYVQSQMKWYAERRNLGA